MQTAELEAMQKVLANQGQLLGRHQQLFVGLNQSVDDLGRRQTEQQAQLSQLLKDVSLQLQSLCNIQPATQPTQPTAASTEIVNPTTHFSVSKLDKFDGSPDKCSGFLLQCSVFFSNSQPSSDKAKIEIGRAHV